MSEYGEPTGLSFEQLKKWTKEARRAAECPVRNRIFDIECVGGPRDGMRVQTIVISEEVWFANEAHSTAIDQSNPNGPPHVIGKDRHTGSSFGCWTIGYKLVERMTEDGYRLYEYHYMKDRSVT